ncbi:hypothetical protein LRR81_00855 [Metabacillus sp. GX 13764]|uniref:hypothetical protein n=1 Tax=Metabacillus kandeliae TaxID=2900151 RepID=UPI001E4113F1|nr:hypothetical protein [Metabacillus kandeliae]MCD7032758.1 hypothetical protein [Metabacillus kandeliae]
MKQNIKAAWIILLLFSFFAAGCAEATAKIKSIQQVDLIALKQFTASHVKDDFAMSELMRNLAGGETVQKIDVSNSSLKVWYGKNKRDLSEKEIHDFWFGDSKTLEKIFLYNAIYMALLVPDAEEIQLNAGGRHFEVPRSAMDELFKKELTGYKNTAQLSNKDSMESLLNSNQKKIQDLIFSDSFRKQFYQEHPISNK